ncbi:hypothetical protein XPA_005659 [Xanthoria parietina]
MSQDLEGAAKLDLFKCLYKDRAWNEIRIGVFHVGSITPLEVLRAAVNTSKSLVVVATWKQSIFKVYGQLLSPIDQMQASTRMIIGPRILCGHAFPPRTSVLRGIPRHFLYIMAAEPSTVSWSS